MRAAKVNGGRSARPAQLQSRTAGSGRCVHELEMLAGMAGAGVDGSGDESGRSPELEREFGMGGGY